MNGTLQPRSGNNSGARLTAARNGRNLLFQDGENPSCQRVRNLCRTTQKLIDS